MPAPKPEPATPEAQGARFSSQFSQGAATQSGEKHPIAKLKHHCHVDASPASTYGETAVDMSAPSTPGDPLGGDGLSNAVQCLRLELPFAERKSNQQSGVSCTSIEEDQYMTSHANVAQVSPGHAPVHQSSSDELVKVGLRRSGRDTDRNDPFVAHEAACEPDFQDLIKETTQPSLLASSPWRPRPDRDLADISGENAQAVFPPNACVFVANLTATKVDEQLEYAVTQVFEQFGKVYVKIKRDNRGMPYAFCQFETVADSERAIIHGRGQLVDGRPCRTERAKVNRSLYLSRITGGMISKDEACGILSGRGALEKLWHASPTDLEMFRLPEGIWIMFAFFQDCRDAHAAFKDNSEYRLEQPALPEDLRARLGRSSSASPAKTPGRGGLLVSPVSIRPEFMFDRRTLLVGGFSPSTTSEQLRSHFATYGVVLSVKIVSHASVVGTVLFAYVELETQEQAMACLGSKHVLAGHHLRVERKQSTEHHGYRAPTSFNDGSPRRRSPPRVPFNVGLCRNQEGTWSRYGLTSQHPASSIHMYDSQAHVQYPTYNLEQQYQMGAYTAFASPFYSDNESAGNPILYSPCAPCPLTGYNGYNQGYGSQFQVPYPTESPQGSSYVIPTVSSAERSNATFSATVSEGQ